MRQDDSLYQYLLDRCQSPDLKQRLEALRDLRRYEYVHLLEPQFLLDRLKSTSHWQEQKELLGLMYSLKKPLPISANAVIQRAKGGWRSLTPEARQVLWDDGIGSQELWEAGKLAGMDQEEEVPERAITWHSPWPEHLLPFCEWGCNIVTYIHGESGQIFQGMRGPDLFVAASLEEWLERWLAGEELQLM